MDIRKRSILGYKVIGDLNSNDGLFEIMHDLQGSRLIFDTNALSFNFTKASYFEGDVFIKNSQVLTVENAGTIGNIDAATLSGLALNDNIDLSVPENNAIYSSRKIMDLLSNSIVPDNIDYINPGYPDISNVKTALDTLLYVPLEISSFTNNKSINEKGSTISSITFNWSYNTSLMTSQSFNGISLPTIDRTKTLTNVSSNTTCTLQASDGKTTTSKQSYISFVNGRYFGISSNATPSHNMFYDHLTKELSESKTKTFSVNATINDYIYFCLPERLGECKFAVGGFEGGFTQLPMFSYTNQSGFTESYRIYRSDHKGLGETTIEVTPK